MSIGRLTPATPSTRPGNEQLRGDVGRRAAVHVGKDEDAAAAVELLHERARLRQQQQRIVLRGDAELLQARRPLVEHVARAVDEAFAQRAVRDDENSDH